jgi:hypothetical protein
VKVRLLTILDCTVHALVNTFCSRYLDFINKLAMYWIAATVVIILIVTLSMADHRNSGSYVFGHYDASASGWSVALPEF